MIHKWTEEGRDEQVAIFLRWVATLVAFTLVALIVVAVQRTITKARMGVQGTYSQQSGNDADAVPDTPLNSLPTVAGGGAVSNPRAANAAYASGQPLGAAPASTYVAPASSSLMPPAMIAPGTAFAVESQRREAAASLSPLKDLMVTVQDFDSRVVNTGFSSGDANSMPIAMQTREDDVSDSRNTDLSSESARRRSMQRILDLSNGVDANISVVAHPDNFAPPLRDGVGEVSKELKTYLATLRNAVSRPDNREELRGAASRHLAAAEQALRSLENLTGGSGIGSTAN